MKKTIAMLMALVLCVGIFAGCGGNSSETTPATDAAVNAAPANPSVFTVGIDSDIDDFNPMTNQMNNYMAVFILNVYEPLFHLNDDMEYEMDLATSVEQLDELTYEITLREGVKFHNGQDFTAADVINTIEYIMDEANGAWRISQYATVDNMVADGDYKLTITLSTPTPAFMDNLAYTPIFCKEDDPTALSSSVNGTGAFKFVNWSPNDKIEFEKFVEYWDADAVSYEKLILKPYPDYTVAITNMEAGAIDMLNRVTVDNATTIDSKDGLKTISAKSSNAMDLFEVGRHNVEAFNDPKVIEAMLLAFDANSINEAIYQGRGTVMTSCYPSGAKYHKDVMSNEYDLEKAKAALAESNYPDGFEFTCKILKGYDSGEMAAIIWQSSLAQIGITMNVVNEEMSVWLENYLARTYDMIWNAYGMVGSDPATFNSIIMEQLYTYQLSDLTELQDLIDEGKAISDEAKREEIYGKIQEIVAENLPVFPYIEAPLICGAQEYVNGLEINGMGHLCLKNVTLG